MSHTNNTLLKEVNSVALAELDRIGSEHKGEIADDVIDVIGVISGVKPAAFIGGDSSSISSELLEKLGLVYTTSKIKNIVYVSQSKEAARRLASLHEKIWGNNAKFPNQNREIGTLLGYPATSTQYFLARLPVYGTPDELPLIVVKRTKNTVSEHFQGLILSPDHFEEELALYCEPLEEAVQLYTPKTYMMLQRTTTYARYKELLSRVIARVGGKSPTILTKEV